ncbi:N-carbomoyl-D-amino acid amidohydrolase [Paenibacillus darwinianus]|uniref:N-carbomoyl-D-amino acid amidohydrolase n=1 Tax=Paenibacillus darwinianus TaxID=1380763 RepID=A0A9W5S237_9BACL|nr:carbon-nitrogen hydrolase family protein [Paenibacillus darwinianus]EXX87046.1 N-carbomoyl-D-amino acid amidohydrolase [Paenibacillus darwinianus]EXX90580.1 N-carbomoyl-D-amino acid amidohydrolase [Paenibacillus darwinianus]EXX90606.1 N-carbomoyl-D-amino acid amidohydrolase [Paenibacillus darwinianus]
MIREGNRLTVAAVQMNCVLGDVEANLRKAERLLEIAAGRGARLAVLPELFNTGYRVEERDVELAEPIPGPTTEWMRRQASKHGMKLVAAILEKGAPAGLVYDTAVLVEPAGVIGSYRKTHLWNQENTRFTRGEQFPVYETDGIQVGLQICYEIGFPEGARILTFHGADIIVYPSAFGKARLYAWDIATRSRALENGTFVIASNRTGLEKGETEFGGTSRIVDPAGTILAEAEQEDDVITAELDLGLIAEQRRAIPYLRDFNRSLISKEYNSER